jgi:Holliday junction resolvasome RuvABC DNA-binding subunit
MGGDTRGEAGPPPPDPEAALAQFVSLPGVGEKLAGRLVAAGYFSLATLTEAKVEALQEIEGIGPKSAERILQVAREAVSRRAAAPAGEEPETPAVGEAVADAAAPAAEAV